MYSLYQLNSIQPVCSMFCSALRILLSGSRTLDTVESLLIAFFVSESQYIQALVE
jgi:hypothetical protein